MDKKIIILAVLLNLLLAEDIADHFREKQYYFEAITEYKRKLYKKKQNRDSLLFKIGHIYYSVDKRKKAEKYLLELLFNEEKTILDNRALILVARLHWKNYDYSAFRNTLDFLNRKTDSLYNNDINYIKAWSYYYDAKWEEGNRIIEKINPVFKDSLLKDIHQVQNVPQKSKLFALISSSVIPGTGQLYAGDYENAGFSFLLVGSIGGSIVWNVIQQAYGIAVVKYLFLFTRYYRGGLHNLAGKIERENIDRIGNYLKEIANKYPDPMEQLEGLIK